MSDPKPLIGTLALEYRDFQLLIKSVHNQIRKHAAWIGETFMSPDELREEVNGLAETQSLLDLLEARCPSNPDEKPGA